jgi:DNA polymerase-3 subunit gamma/tau
MDYIALYRKYRPQTFDEVVEQDSVVKILREELKKGKISHAYLFAGP